MNQFQTNPIPQYYRGIGDKENIYKGCNPQPHNQKSNKRFQGGKKKEFSPKNSLKDINICTNFQIQEGNYTDENTKFRVAKLENKEIENFYSQNQTGSTTSNSTKAASLFEKLNSVFKAQVDYTNNPKPKRDRSNPRWDDRKKVERIVLKQNIAIQEGRFDPVQYFGGYTPEEVGTGIIRKVISQIFHPPEEPRSSDPSPDVDKEFSNIIPKMNKTKASHSQAELDPAKCPSMAEISNSLQSSQSRINQLVNNLQSLKCSMNPKDKAKCGPSQTNSYLNYNNPKFKKVKKHKSALWSNTERSNNGKKVRQNWVGEYSKEISSSIHQLKSISSLCKHTISHSNHDSLYKNISRKIDSKKFKTKLKLCGSNDKSGYSKDAKKLLGETSKNCLTIANEFRTERPLKKVSHNSNKCSKNSSYSRLKNGPSFMKEGQSYHTLFELERNKYQEYLDKPMKRFLPSGRETPVNDKNQRLGALKSRIECAKAKIKSSTSVTSFEKNFMRNKSRSKKKATDQAPDGRLSKSTKRSKTRSKSKHSRSKQRIKSKSKQHLHPLSHRTNSVDHQSINSTLDFVNKMKKDLKKLNPSKLSRYFKKCKSKATKNLQMKNTTSFRKGGKNKLGFGQRTSSIDLQIFR
ncbi:unnamed protein product [Moneuplotes crassus]|uniref:Uncharacterized protein n=1 Tax=Euplotes crassus TaxID=5936 RepID=A0AAD1X361_EUPCR|nr:unnamed protein product [Moneuplotes crassus]